MAELTTKEKGDYHRKLKQHSKLLRKYLNIPNNWKIGEVGYGVPVENDYFFYDYPYNEKVDEINEQVSNDPELKNLLETTWDGFFAKQQEELNGYIYYRYSICDDKKHFWLYDIQTNLFRKEDPRYQTIIQFLAIAHFNIKTNSDYRGNVEECKEPEPGRKVKQIIYVVKHLDKFLKKVPTESQHILTLTLKRKRSKNFSKDLNTIEFSYDVLMELLEAFCKSQITQKLMHDNRMREVLFYQHNIYNLRLPMEMGRLKSIAELSENKELKDKVFDLHRRYKLLRLMLFFTFKFESFDNSSWDKFPLSGKSLCGIIDYFKTELTPKEITVDFKYDHKECDSRIPAHYFLSDITQVLWNLWNNAIVQTSRTYENDKTFEVKVSLKNQNVELQIENYGLIPIPLEYADYINSEVESYPGKQNKNKKYKGLQIVKSICLENNWKIRCRRNSIEKKTTIILELNNEIWK